MSCIDILGCVHIVYQGYNRIRIKYSYRTDTNTDTNSGHTIPYILYFLESLTERFTGHLVETRNQNWDLTDNQINK